MLSSSKVALLVASLGTGFLAPSSPASATQSSEGLLEAAAALQVTLRTTQSDDFGGMWVDEQGDFVVAVAGGGTALSEAVVAADLGIPIEIRQVAYAQEELDAIHARIVDEAGPIFAILDMPLAAIETDILNNRVNVLVAGDYPSAARLLAERYGSAIEVKLVSSRAVGVACTNSNCPNPLKAGARLYKSGTYACMSSFVMRSIANTYYLSTAGHCSNVGNTWQHPSGTAIGTASHQGWVDFSPADVALISIAQSQKGNKLCAGPACVIASITARENPASGQEFIGEQTCVARKTSTACGNLISTNNTIGICRSDGECHPITNLRRTSFSVSPGDSGAPVYSLPRAIGVVSASYPGDPTDAVYSHIINVEGYFLMSTQLTP